jgi:hypothetical protein
MSALTYYQNIPASGDDPTLSQPQLQTNTNSVFTITAVDHIGYGATNGGYHTIIHQGNSNEPTTKPSINQVYAQTDGTDTILYNKSGDGQVSRLTGHLDDSAGFQWIGGALIMWGTDTTAFGAGNGTGSVLFSSYTGLPNFTNGYNVQITPSYGGTDPTNRMTIAAKNLTTTGFTYAYSAGGGNYVGFYWTAIGN